MPSSRYCTDIHQKILFITKQICSDSAVNGALWRGAPRTVGTAESGTSASRSVYVSVNIR